MIKSKSKFGSPEYLRERLGKYYMTEEDEKEFNRKIASGELVVISNDDPCASYYPPVSLENVSLEKSQADLRRLMDDARKSGDLVE